MTHPGNEPCPFEKDNFPVGMIASCCSIRGKAAAYELEALGEASVAAGMYDDMTCTEAYDFGLRLNGAARMLELRYANADEKPKGYAWNTLRRSSNSSLGDVVSEGTPFEEALECIREAGRWYQKVGGLGFGVHAWY